MLCFYCALRCQAQALSRYSRFKRRRQYKRIFNPILTAPTSKGSIPNRMTMDNVTCLFFEQPLDHFSSSTNLKFKQRYCIYDGYEKQLQANESERSLSPIFFYTGNESPIDEYVNNTGLIFELASNEYFSAKIVFAEHRFEGVSVPDGQTFHAFEKKNMGCFTYLTSSQALMDFVALLSHLNPDSERPVIAFGGSYGGMLSSWLRMKYPETVLGAIASSAPIFGLPLTMEDESGNIDITTKDSGEHNHDYPLIPNYKTMDGAHRVLGNAVRMTKPESTSFPKLAPEENFCFDNLLAAWPLIQFYGQTEKGRNILSKKFDLCRPLQNEDDVSMLLEWAQSPWFDLAEGDYPYNSSYIPYALGEGLHELPGQSFQL